MGRQAIHIQLDKELWKRVGIESAKQDMTRRDLVAKALNEYMSKDNEKRG